MRTLVLTTFLVAGLGALALVAAQDAPDAKEKDAPDAPALEMPTPGEPLPEHEWLRGLVGEWDVVTEATMGPGAEPMRMESTESARMLGGFWLISEGEGDFGGLPVGTHMTLGYDTEKKKFIGTWIDTMHAYMWHYVGTLDEAKKVLTLSTEGPDFSDPTKKSRYRDVFEIVSPDHKRLTSSVEGEDGKWMTFVTADFRRKE